MSDFFYNLIMTSIVLFTIACGIYSVHSENELEKRCKELGVKLSFMITHHELDTIEAKQLSKE